MTYDVLNNVGVVRALYDATDVEAATKLMESDCEWVESQVEGMPFTGTLRGPQAVRDEVYERVSEFFDTFSLVPDQIFEPDGDAVVATGRVHALTKSGKQLDASFVHVFEISEGKIRRCTNYHDSALWLAALNPDVSDR